MAIQKFESGAVQVKKELPSEEIFRMDYLDGWEEVSQAQKAYLCSYFDTFPKKIRACVQSGVSQSAYNDWKNNDKVFKALMQLIEQIHREELEYLEYIESYEDPKVRGRYLKKGSSGSTTKNQTVIFNNSGESSSFSKLDRFVEDIDDDQIE